MLDQLAVPRLENEGPALHRGDVDIRGRVGEPLLYTLLETLLYQQFLGREIGYQQIEVVQVALSHLELSGGHVQECDTAPVLRETQRGDIVVLLLGQHLVAVDHARRDNLGDPPLDQLLGQLRILQLVAHSHLIPGPHQLGHVARKRMVRKPRQLDIALVSVRLAGLHDAQHLAGSHRILPVRLIEVPHPHQQQGLRTSRLELVVLLYQRRILLFLFFLVCHFESLPI